MTLKEKVQQFVMKSRYYNKSPETGEITNLGNQFEYQVFEDNRRGMSSGNLKFLAEVKGEAGFEPPPDFSFKRDVPGLTAFARYVVSRLRNKKYILNLLRKNPESPQNSFNLYNSSCL